MATEFRKISTARSVLASDRGIRCPHMGYPKADYLTPESIMPAGLAWYKDSENYIIPLKRARIKSAVNTATIQLQRSWATVFEVGDVLISADKVGTSVLSGAWNGAEVVTFNVDGIGAASINLADAGVAIGSASEAGAALVRLFGSTGYSNLLEVFAYDNPTSGNTDLHFISKTPGQQGAHDVSVTVLGGTGAATDPAASDHIAVGTISAIDTENHTVTVGAAVTLPPGLGIKVAQPEASLDAIREGGLRYEEHAFNLAENYGLLTSGTLYLKDMHWDYELAFCFPEIQSA